MTIDPRVAYAAIVAGSALLLGCLILLYMVASKPGSSLSFSAMIASFYGKKTYIIGTTLLIVDQIHDLGWLSDPTTTKVEKILLVLAAFTLKAAQNRADEGQRTILAQNRRLIVESGAANLKKEEEGKS